MCYFNDIQSRIVIKYVLREFVLLNKEFNKTNRTKVVQPFLSETQPIYYKITRFKSYMIKSIQLAIVQALTAL